MQIKVFSGFSKRINSTKQPTGGTTVDVLLKDDCSILNPTFILNTLDFSINYVQAFGNYYFCDVRNLDGHRSELNCSLDHLATFKTQIAGYTGLVEYTSSSSNVAVVDPRNKPTGLLNYTKTAAPWASNVFGTTGCYILSVVNNKSNGDNGCTTYYAMLPAQLEDFSKDLFGAGWFQQADFQINGVQDSIISCHWLPIDITKISGSSEKIAIGGCDMPTAMGKNITGRILTVGSGLIHVSFASSGGFGNQMTYLEMSPYANGVIYLPFVGLVPLDMDIVAYYKTIEIVGKIDIITGDIVYKIMYANDAVSTYSGNCATKIPVSGASVDGVGIATGAMTVIGGGIAVVATVATGGGAAMLLGGAAAAVGGSVSLQMKQSEIHTQINGNNSSAVAVELGTDPYVIVIQNQPIESNLLSYQTEQGMPYFKTATIGNLSGYVQCSGASVNIPGDGSEQNTVNGYLNSGFYYE